MQNQNRVEIGKESFGLLHSVGMGSKESEREGEGEVCEEKAVGRGEGEAHGGCRQLNSQFQLR